MYSLVKVFYHTAWYFWDHFTLLLVSVIYVFLLLSRILLYGYTTLFACSSVSCLGIWVKLLWTFSYKSFRGHMFLFFMVKNLGLELLGHKGRYMFSFRRNCQVFSLMWLYYFILPSTMFWHSVCSTYLPASGIVDLPTFSYSGGCVVITLGVLNLLFPDD